MLLGKNEQGKILLHIARIAISHALRISCLSATVDENIGWLSQSGAAFVTLTQEGELRGCVGSLQACDTLIEDLSNDVVSAALYDFRFLPLVTDELDTINLEVSVILSELQPLAFISEADALAQLRPNIDGVVLEYGPYRSIFLPQVWNSLPHPQQFLAKLKSKAKLSEDFWAEEIKLSCYTVSIWREIDYSKEYVYG